MASALVLAALTWSGWLQVWHIAALAALNGVAHSFDAPARMALIPQLVEDRRDLQNAVAMNATMFNLARVLGPAVGGFVLAGMGAGWCFALNGASFLATLLAVFGMRLAGDVGNPSRGRAMLAEIGEGLGYVWREPVVRTLTAMIAVNSTFGFAYSVLLPAYAADVLKVGEKGYGFLNAAVGIGALAGALAEAALGRRKAKGLQITMGSLLFPLAVLAFAATRWLPLALVCLAAAGAGFVIQNATANTVIQMLVPDVLRARVMSVYSLCFFGTTPVGALLAGAAAERWGATAAVLLGSGVTLAFGLWVLARVPVVRRTRL